MSIPVTGRTSSSTAPARAGQEIPVHEGTGPIRSVPEVADPDVVDVDRAAHLRTDPELPARLVADPATRFVLVRGAALATDGDVLLRIGAGDPRARDLVGQVRADGAPGPVRWIFLGEAVDGTAGAAPVVALVVPSDVVAEDDAASSGRSEVTWRSLRELLPVLSAADVAIALPAVALVAWHANHPRCSRCGDPTVVAAAGWLRHCPVEGVEHYPRTDPAVIMAVVDADDRLLLGHAAAWPEGRFSTLAGYVEPGETLEDAVRREVHEEVGVDVGDVTYRWSQPWPFPASLMLGFTAQATSTEITVDGVEVTEARWSTRAELLAAVHAGTLLLPGRASIARRLVEDWFGGELPGGW